MLQWKKMKDLLPGLKQHLPGVCHSPGALSAPGSSSYYHHCCYCANHSVHNSFLCTNHPPHLGD